MNCSNCGAKNSPKFAFCDSCGSPLKTANASIEGTEKSISKSPQKSRVGDAAAMSNSLSLTTWAGLRWLFATNYGRLTLTQDHLNHSVTKFWAYNIYSVIVKIFNWGFDIPASLALSEGATALKSVTTVRIFGIQWLAWKGHFLFIWSGGFPDIYFFSAKQLVEVQNFVEQLKLAAAEAKYAVSK